MWFQMMFNKKGEKMAHVRFLVCVLFLHLSCVGTISLYNHTDYDLYAGTYYVATSLVGQSIGPATRVGDRVILPAQASIKIKRPSFTFGRNRELLVSTDQTSLTEFIEKKEYKKHTTVPIGWNNGSSFHFASKDNMITGYSEFDWHVVLPILSSAQSILHGGLQELQQQYLQHAYADERAKVTHINGPSSKEKLCVDKRMTVTKNAIENLMGVSLTDEQVPRIAICMSGGGMRAALCSYGLFQGLADCGLLDTVTYASALSGSTWFLSHYLHAGLPIDQYRQELFSAMTEVHLFAPDALAYNLWAKYLWQQHLSIVDLYGVYLAETFLRHIPSDMDRQKAKLSDLQTRTRDGNWPFPLFTAVESSHDLLWYSFTPYEICCEKLGYAIPEWSLGRTFLCEQSIDCPPELSLGFLMGMWGSALSGTLAQMLETQKETLNSLLYQACSNLLVSTGLDDAQWAAIKINNPLYCTQKNDFMSQKKLTFIDGGYAYNIPLPPLLNPKRSVDLIIVLDTTENIHNRASEMEKALKHIQAEGWPFPKIDTKVLNKQAVSFWKDKNKSAPIVIYIVPVKDKEFCLFDPAEEFNTEYSTARFVYNKTAFNNMTELMRHVVAQNRDVFVQAIHDIILRKAA